MPGAWKPVLGRYLRRCHAVRGEAMTEFDVLVAGEINPDLILSDPRLEPRFSQQETLVEDAELAIGSSSAIFACGAARLGLRVAFIGAVGDDLFGQFMLEALRRRSIDVTPVLADPGQKTGVSVILARGADRAILTHIGAMGALRADHLSDELLGRARHLHVASYFLQAGLRPGLLGLFHRAHRLGLTTSLDTNWDPAGQWGDVESLLPATDIFLPNDNEARALARASSAPQALSALAAVVPTVAIKLGAEGAIAQRGSETAQAPALPMAVADTVGAGDSFDAGFIYGCLQDWPLDRCLRLATICGSLSVRGHGGTAAQPGLQEALEYLSGETHGSA